MTRRALGGLGGTVVLALALVGLVPSPARAAQAPAIALTSPGSGAVLTGPTPITGQATMSGGRVLSVTLRVLNAGGQAVTTTSFTNDDNTLDFSWTPVIPVNGNYTVAVEAWGRENIDFNGDESSSASRPFAMEAPPAPPANVKTAVDQAKRTVTLTWDANNEPDLLGYSVFRKVRQEWVAVSEAIPAGDPRTFTHTLGSLPAGTYSYAVFAGRPNAAGDNVVLSSTAAPPAKVTSSPPPPPTTTTKPGSTGGSSATTVTTTKGPTVATRGRTDMAGFASLLPNGGAQLPNAPRAPRAAESDNGFEQDLPFQAPGATQDEDAGGGEDDPVQALGGRSVVSSGDDERPTSLLFMAGGLLVTVVLMHLLWLRDEVNKGLLPAVEPSEGPAPLEG